MKAATEAYVMGYSESERQRLALLAQIRNPFVESLLRRADFLVVFVLLAIPIGYAFGAVPALSELPFIAPY